MALFKRIGLFLMVNLLIMVTISVLLNLLNVQPYLTRSGLNYGSLLIFCMMWGFGGAFISLALSRQMAKWMMGVKVIAQPADGTQRWLLDTIAHLAMQANLTKTPEVGIYASDDVNAFATGPTKSRSLVAVSSGLLQNMDKAAVEGVLAHEIAHIANGDMVTMTLLQGVVNAFVMFFARIIAWGVSQSVSENQRHLVNFITTITLEILLGFLGMIVVATYSRRREYRADRGGAKLVGTGKMVAALKSLQAVAGRPVHAEPKEAMAAFQIAGKSRFLALLSTHPALELRIAALQ